MTFGAPDWFSAENLRKRASLVAEVETWAWDSLGEIMHGLFAEQERPGPPWTHTFTAPQPAVFTTSGKLLYRPPPPGPGYTLTTTADG